MANFLYLSPHFDDVALSCGGLLVQHARRQNSVSVLTICAGVPDYTHLSAFAREQHQRWGFPVPRDPIAARRTEDVKALKQLGASPAYLDVPDAIYRRNAHGRPIVSSNRTLFGAVHRDEQSLVRHIAHAIVAWLPRKRDTLIIAPLAAGRHVDHQLVRDAARLLLSERYHVVWYEDFPYAATRGAVTRARRAFGSGEWSLAVYPIDVEQKIKAIAAYTSQLKSTFNGKRAMAARVCAYNHAIAHGDGYAERIWHFEGRQVNR